MKCFVLAFLALFPAVTPALPRPSSPPHPSIPSSQAAPSPNPSASAPAAKPDDVKSIDAILRSLFAPGARLTSTAKSATSSAPRLLTVDDYIHLAGDYFDTHGFFEAAIVNRVQKFGNIAQVFSSYESRNAANEKPF